MFTQKGISFKVFCSLLTLSFLIGTIAPGYAQSPASPSGLLSTSPAHTPWALKGIKVYPDDPLKFDFLLEEGEQRLSEEELKIEAELLIRYFLACLSLPEDELWVNLSPFEQDKIIPEFTSQTELGKGLLEQDYLLKQLVSSLTYPETSLGEDFWQKVYQKAYQRFGTSKIPVNTFNKVWIVPDKAVVYEDGQRALISESRLKVMLEEDYLAFKNSLQMHNAGRNTQDAEDLSNLSSQIMREVIIPALEEELNQGKHFAQLRQIYRSFILASWFKQRLRESLLGEVYVDQKKLKGLDLAEPGHKEKVYQEYLSSYKQGLYNYIRTDYSPQERKHIKRRYWSGGMRLSTTNSVGIPVMETDTVSSSLLNKLGKWATGNIVVAMFAVLPLLSPSLNNSYIPTPEWTTAEAGTLNKERQMVTLKNGKEVRKADLYMAVPVLYDLYLNDRKAFFELWKALYSIGWSPTDINRPPNHITSNYTIDPRSKSILEKRGLITSYGQSSYGAGLTNFPRFVYDITLAMVDKTLGEGILDIKIVSPVSESLEEIRDTVNAVVNKIIENLRPLFKNNGQPIIDFLFRHQDISEAVKKEIKEALKEAKESFTPEGEKAIKEYLNTWNLPEAKVNLARAQGISEKLAERMLILVRLKGFVAFYQFGEDIITASPEFILEILPYLMQGTNGIDKADLIKSIQKNYNSYHPGYELTKEVIERILLDQANFYALAISSSPLDEEVSKTIETIFQKSSFSLEDGSEELRKSLLSFFKIRLELIQKEAGVSKVQGIAEEFKKKKMERALKNRKNMIATFWRLDGEMLFKKIDKEITLEKIEPIMMEIFEELSASSALEINSKNRDDISVADSSLTTYGGIDLDRERLHLERQGTASPLISPSALTPERLKTLRDNLAGLKVEILAITKGPE